MLAALVVAAPSVASAQASAAVARIQRFGRADRPAARRIARRVHERLTANAARGGGRYDPLRQALGAALFGGPGRTRAEYDARLREVLARMGRGLTEDNLTLLFGGGDALQCARLFELSMPDCDALAAAAARRRADLPHIPPDDGATLRRTLVEAGMSEERATAAVRGMRAALLSVPAAADRTARGRTLTRMMDACPGGLPDLEAKVRAWHLGPTETLVRCIVRTVGRQGRPAPVTLREVFGVGDAAVLLLRWAHDQAVRDPRAPPPEPPTLTRDDWMARGARAYRARRFRDAAQAYARAVEMEPGYPPAQRGLAVSRFRAGDVAGAVEAYRALARLEPSSAAVQVGLARALVRAGDREGAIAAYQLAIALDPTRGDARRELARLRSGEVADGAPAEDADEEGENEEDEEREAAAASSLPSSVARRPRLPETPSRDDVIRTLAPFRPRLEACAPEVGGTVTIRLVIAGATGEVREVETVGAHADSDHAECWEAQLSGARFPRFSRERLEIRYPFELEGAPAEAREAPR